MTGKEYKLVVKWRKRAKLIFQHYEISKNESLYLAQAMELLFCDIKYFNEEEIKIRSIFVYHLAHNQKHYNVQIRMIKHYLEHFFKPTYFKLSKSFGAIYTEYTIISLKIDYVTEETK